MTIRSFLAFAILICAAASPSMAWTDHALIGYAALTSTKEAKGTVKAESLLTFLRKETKALGVLLDQEEEWARANVPTYPARPDALRFTNSKERDLVVRFLRAIRVNPSVHTDLYVQPSPAGGLKGRPEKDWDSISILKRNHVMLPFAKIGAGEDVSILEVLSSGCDEPDYGLDIKLWEDSETAYGKDFGFGAVPFGNPKLEYSTQAPFHMGFYHEAGFIYAAAPFLKRTYAEARIHMYLSLARFAFRTGHPYWGYRFTGWGLHYVQDLAQPYHARTLPSTSSIGMLWINILDIIGIHGPKVRAIEHVSNTHTLIERLQYVLMREGLKKKESENAVIKSMIDTSMDGKLPAFDDQYVRNVLTLKSHGVAGDTDDDLTNAVPESLLSDFSAKEMDSDAALLKMLNDMPADKRAKLEKRLNELMGDTASHTRVYLQAARAGF